MDRLVSLAKTLPCGIQIIWTLGEGALESTKAVHQCQAKAFYQAGQTVKKAVRECLNQKRVGLPLCRSIRCFVNVLVSSRGLWQRKSTHCPANYVLDVSPRQEAAPPMAAAYLRGDPAFHSSPSSQSSKGTA